jgi:BirA family biotin operon repressor/biotin-[acetyl-CoA-carboxylase] ligase
MAESDPKTLDGTVVLAERQDNGRGRQETRWISPSGGLWLSIILTPKIHVTRSALLNFIAILATCEAIESKTNLKCKVKWPNDVMINRKKVCGIIVDLATKENFIYYSVVGIGINVNVDIQTIIRGIEANSEAEVSITSLKKEKSGRFVNRQSLLKTLLERFNCYYNMVGCETEIVGILGRISQRLEGIGNTMTIEQTNSTTTGELIGLCSEGSLLVKKDDGSISKISGQYIAV